MTQPYLGEIRMFGGNFAPRTNALCNGQLLSIAQNSALFSLLGTYYGGNGTTTFGLPDFRGRFGIHWGQGPGLSNYAMGQTVGTETVTLNTNQIPSHTHIPTASSSAASANTPNNQIPATLAAPWKGFYMKDANKTGVAVPIAPNALSLVGNNLPHENRMPGIALSVIIALQGIFPSRN